MTAGIYIHIPFCRSRCSYCDFATGLYETEAASRYVHALSTELESWSEISGTPEVDTVYFGGGTPSLLSPEQLESLLTSIHSRFRVDSEAEVTMELNPGTAGEPGRESSQVRTLQQFLELGINRISFGAQTFDDRELARLGRSHDSAAVTRTFHNLREAGFTNISFDLIAGLPGQTIQTWEDNLEKAFALRPEHLSFYLLEVHSGTPLAEHIRSGKQPKPDEEVGAEMYERMLDRASTEGYEHYEISNLCLPGLASRHNTKYWTAQPYFGFGCSAHSFDGQVRRWANERDVNRYTTMIEDGVSPVVESQILKQSDVESEAMFLGLRMMEGISTRDYRDQFGFDVQQKYRHELSRFLEAGLVEITEDRIKLTRPGALLSNEVFAAFV
jgi:oxygen-independent coproporphyrinogen III oxidase